MVATQLEFLKPSDIKPSYHMRDHGGVFRSTGDYWSREVCIEDARNLSENFSLDSHGFELIKRSTKLTSLLSDDHIVKNYLPETVDIVQHRLGAKWLEAFDYTIRTTQIGQNQRGPAPRVHNDYSENSALQKFREYLGNDFQRSLENNRLVQLNLWRPFTEPVLVKPLAVADGKTIAPKDLIACDVVYPNRVGENYEVSYDPAQRWLYFSGMMKNEALLLKGFDSAKDGRVRFTPHSSFTHPDTPSDATERWSIEVRLLAII